MNKTQKRQKDGKFKNVHKAKFHVLSYRLNDEEYNELKTLSMKTGDFISAITRMAMKAYLAKAAK